MEIVGHGDDAILAGRGCIAESHDLGTIRPHEDDAAGPWNHKIQHVHCR